ncbi:MAG: hypothetical protein HC897_14530 [Thermoanaerobaculia bacterium]|nr:hypothetical protein [Thermoanaerobaculia bacterium]
MTTGLPTFGNPYRITDSGLAVQPGTSPSAAFYYNPNTNENGIFLFYTGADDGSIWYTYTSDGQAWDPVVQIVPNGQNPLSVNPTASPGTAIVFMYQFNAGRLILFYTGPEQPPWLWLTTTIGPGGTGFTDPASIQNKSVSLMPGTSASTVVFNCNLFSFYNGSGNNGLWYTQTNGPADNFQSWTDASLAGSPGSALDIAVNTSPAAVVFNNVLYLFYAVASTTSANGTQANDIWLTSYDGINWTTPAAVTVGGEPVSTAIAPPATSPSVFALGATLYLFTSSATGTQVTISQDAGQTWQSAGSVPNQAYLPGTGACAATLSGTPYLFWVSPNSTSTGNGSLSVCSWTPG